MSESERRGPGAALLHSALVAEDEGRLEDARVACVSALRELEAAGDLTGQAAAHQLLALLSVHEGDHAEAERHIVAGLGIRQQTRDAEGQIALLNEAYKLYLFRDEHDRALEIAKLALDLCAAVPPRLQADTLQQLVHPLLASERFVEATQLVRSSGWLETERPALQRTAATLQLVQVAVAMGQIAEAAQGCIELVAVARTCEEPHLLADALHQAGAITAVRGDRQGAVRLLTDALDLRTQLDDPVALAFTAAELGSVEAGLGQLEAARARLSRAARIFEDLQQPGDAAEAYHALSQLAERAGDLPEALRAGERVLALVGEAGDMDALGATHFAQGLRHAQLQQLEEAEDHFRRSVQVQEAAQDREGRGMALAMLGQVVAARGRPDEARAHLQAARRMVGDPAGQAQIDDLLANLGG